MRALHRYFGILLTTAVALAAAIGPAQAQTYPDKTIHFIVPWPPGGAADMMARLIGEGISRELGQSVIVENKPGAGGLIGTEAVARAAPDGYTLVLGSTGPNSIAGSLYRNLRYDPAKDLAGVTQITELPLLLIVNASLPVNSVRELIDYAKKNPGKLNFGSVGAGTAQHLTSEIFKSKAGLDMVHVPYKGSAPAFTGLVGGEVQMLFDNIPASQAMIKAGKVKAIAISSRNRSPALPDVPTVAESGLPDFHVVAWQNVAVPAGTPAAVVQRLNTEIVKFINTDAMRKRLTDMGANVVGNTPGEETQRIRDEVAQWGAAVEAAGVKLDY